MKQSKNQIATREKNFAKGHLTSARHAILRAIKHQPNSRFSLNLAASIIENILNNWE